MKSLTNAGYSLSTLIPVKPQLIVWILKRDLTSVVSNGVSTWDMQLQIERGFRCDNGCFRVSLLLLEPFTTLNGFEIRFNYRQSFTSVILEASIGGCY